MDWTSLLKAEVEDAYRATEGLIRQVDPGSLSWKPATGGNWMTTGQLLEHITTACGACCKGFVTGDWGVPEGTFEGELPTAGQLPSAKDVPSTLARLAADKTCALDMIAKAGEKDLAGKKMAAPWNPESRELGRHLLHMVSHLSHHKAQLFYYLKLQGKPVHTGDLYGA
jgi:hypothetical protein